MGVSDAVDRHDHHEIGAGQRPLTLGELAQRSSRVVGGQALANIVGAGDREGHICDLVGRRLVDLPVDLPVRKPD